MKGNIDPYKKLNIKRDSKAPPASDKIKDIMGPSLQHLYDKNFKNSAFLLENYVGNSKPVEDVIPLRKKKSSFKGVLKPSKSDIKRSKVFEVDSEQITFEEMIPIHLMWKEYMKDLLGETKKPSSTDIASSMSSLMKISKCDFHGAVISIFEAKNKTLIGIEGIVIKESRLTFTII